MFIEKSFMIDTFKNIEDKNECIVAMVVETCRTTPELHIPEEAPMDTKIWNLIADVWGSKAELAKVKFELNLKIEELKLKAQPSTPPKVE